MGYFSKWNEQEQHAYRDQSYHGSEEQLIWRQEELMARYNDLVRAGAPRTGDDLFTTDDYRYAPARYFKTISGIQKAIEIAEERWEDLFPPAESKNNPDNDSNNSDNEENEDDSSVIEIVYLPSWFESFAAA